MILSHMRGPSVTSVRRECKFHSLPTEQINPTHSAWQPHKGDRNPDGEHARRIEIAPDADRRRVPAAGGTAFAVPPAVGSLGSQSAPQFRRGSRGASAEEG